MSNRITASIVCVDPEHFKRKLFFWMKSFKEMAFFDSNHFNVPDMIKGNQYDWIAGIGSLKTISPTGNCFYELQKYLDAGDDWWCGFLGYDLKNEIELLHSRDVDELNAPPCFFFQPEIIISADRNEITISIHEECMDQYKGPTTVYELINLQPPYQINNQLNPRFSNRISKNRYIKNVLKILKHIQFGDIYEMNYCMEFFAKETFIDPISVFLMLQKNVPAPQSCYFRLGNCYIMSASPERYLRKEGYRLISQPMKGTTSRGLTESQDVQKKQELLSDEKERSENVMIVDLVRNDLSKIAIRGSVHVDELLGLYTFPKVHQMVSTISCTIDPGITFCEIIRGTFPMGSMTGAPKIKAMQLIEKYEESKRGIFSGAAGYIAPNGDFDFNVMIRSFIYREDKKYLSIMAGSAITANSDPAKEYEECILKAGYSIEAIGGKFF